MLNTALERLKAEGPYRPNTGPNLHLLCRDAIPLPYKDNTFDLIYSAFCFDQFDTPDIPVIMDECFRVLKQEGRICVVAMAKRGKEGLIVKFYEWLHEKLPQTADCRPIYLRESLQHAGFTILQTQEWSSLGVPVDIVLAKK